MRSRRALLVLTLAAAACQKTNPDYCELDDECASGHCDPAAHQCVAGGQADAAVEIDAAIDAARCGGDLECTVENEPICDSESGQCRACGGEQECAARDGAAAHCAGDGRCVACTDSDHCAAEAPICDLAAGTCGACGGPTADLDCETRDPGTPRCASDGTCAACLGDGDCSSEVCDEGTRTCVPGDEIIYVDENGNDGGGCGEQLDPCQTLSDGEGGLSKVEGDRRTILLRAGDYQESVTISGLDVYITGPAAARIMPPGAGNEPGFRITGGSQVTIEGITVANALGGNNADGVRCDNASQATLLAMTISNNDATGVEANDCDLVVERSRIDRNGGGGVSVTDGEFRIVNDFVIANGTSGVSGTLFGGVRIQNNSAFATQILAFSTVVDNFASSTGALSSGVHCQTSSAMTASSNIVYFGTGAVGGARISGTCAWAFSNVEGALAPPGDGNLAQDPLFSDPVDSDYHLRAGSVCEGKASTDGVPAVDFDGDPRPAGTGPDMGADEIVP